MPKKRDWFWLTLIVGGIFAFAASLFAGRMIGNYLIQFLGPKKPPVAVTLPEQKTPVKKENVTVEVKVSPLTQEIKATQEVKAKETPSLSFKPASQGTKPQRKKIVKKSQTEKPDTKLQEQPPQSVPLKAASSFYRVQTGVFGKKENAQVLADKLKKGGYEAVVKEVKQNGTSYFKVQAGVFKDKQNAQKLATNLKTKGYDAFVSEAK